MCEVVKKISTLLLSTSLMKEETKQMIKLEPKYYKPEVSPLFI